MKQYDNLSYNENTCPLAKKIENAVNSFHSSERHISDITEFINEDELTTFCCACICYWSETQVYDKRNITAVLASRAIIAQYPALKDVRYSEQMLKEAFGFTRSAHRHLQQTMFNAAMVLFARRGTLGIADWYNNCSMVIDEEAQEMIPMATYRIRHPW